MKILKYIAVCSLIIFFVAACNKGIDSITSIPPGADESAPEITINYPVEGTLLRVKEDVTSVNIKFEATDDIELQSISVKLDGTEITKFSSFKDYRRAIEEYLYNNVTNGTHTLNITATDLSGKNTSKSVTFEKAEPYKAKYTGEVFYMPFDGDFMELLSIKDATKVGSPDFVTGKVGKAYAGATDSYLTFPSAGILDTEFSAVFWYKINATPDRAGILMIPLVGEKEIGDNRNFGLRFAREADGAKQKFWLNIGNGSSESWFNPPSFAVSDSWMHVAISISGTHAAVYLNGTIAAEGDYTGPIDWTGCSLISIASGKPYFSTWNHLSDNSLIDELRIFNKALAKAEIQTIIDAEK